jgi:hypothetical protein
MRLVMAARVLYTSVYILMVSPAMIQQALDHYLVDQQRSLRQRCFALNLAGAHAIDATFDALVQLLPRVGLLFGNEDEFFALQNKSKWILKVC